ncbi:MAG: radical SAM protein, partial [archaeon]
MVEKKYTFLESTTSFCSECLKLVDSKIVSKDGKVFVQKFCIEHGEQTELLEEDLDYHLSKAKYEKPGNAFVSQTPIKLGCPFDCGLCNSHEQHTCNGLIEVTDSCDLCCPTCYANSGKGKFMSLSTTEKIMDFFQKVENNQAEILQISGGEPTTHPDILKIIELAKSKNFRYVMLNTNGLRIAKDEKF